MFMAGVNEVTSTGISWGLMPGTEEIPTGYEISFLMYQSSAGIRDTYLEWGDILLDVYGKTRNGWEKDISLKFLSYSTDNGAYYMTGGS